MYYVGMFYIKMYLHVFIINNIVCDSVRQSAVLRSIEVIIADTLVQVSLLSLMSNFWKTRKTHFRIVNVTAGTRDMTTMGGPL